MTHGRIGLTFPKSVGIYMNTKPMTINAITGPVAEKLNCENMQVKSLAKKLREMTGIKRVKMKR